jgi:hypothetical protein
MVVERRPGHRLPALGGGLFSQAGKPRRDDGTRCGAAAAEEWLRFSRDPAASSSIEQM